jgi:hypothetical protein
MILLLDCSSYKQNLTEYFVFKRHTPMGLDIHKLEINIFDSTFSYDYLNNMYGKRTGVIHGTWKKNNDSLLLSILYPIDYNIKRSFVSYSNFGSSDSIYILFYVLYPEVENINQHIYSSVSISLIDDCITDTCPSYESIKSTVLPKTYFSDTIVIPRNFYSSTQLDTFNIFDPNDVLVDNVIPVKVDAFNCISIYLARKPKFDFIEIPTRYGTGVRQLYFKDENGEARCFKRRSN